MREAWGEAFSAQARAYWTEERTRKLTGGKNLIVLPGEAPLLLRALGLLHRNAKMPPDQMRKYRQINHMVAVLGPSLAELRERFDTVHIVDAGCGRSYLTVLLAWCFKNLYHHPVRILGVDRSEAIIEECRRRTEIVGLQDVLKYEASTLEALETGVAWKRAFGQPEPIHAVVSLHACDTATDDAIALGWRSEAHLIAVAPCCQSELAAQWKALAQAGEEGDFSPLWSIPHLRRMSAATVTDTMRTLLIRAVGYRANAIQFVRTEHTPKNTLIRAVRRGENDTTALQRYHALRLATGGAGIALESALPEPMQTHLRQMLHT